MRKGVVVVLCFFSGNIFAYIGFNDVPWVKFASVDTTSWSSGHGGGQGSVKGSCSINLPDSMANKFSINTYGYAYGTASESEAGRAHAIVRATVTKTGFSVLPPFVLNVAGQGSMQSYYWGVSYTREYGLSSIELCINGFYDTVWKYYDSEPTWVYTASICTTITSGTVTMARVSCMSEAYTEEYHYGGEAWNRNIFEISSMSIEPLGIEENENIKMKNEKLEICQNPFVQSTIISYQLPVKANVELKIYNLSGRTLKTLINEEKQAGIYNLNWDAKDLATGVYFVELRVGNDRETKKAMLVK